MRIIADLHVHSKYSRATSKNMIIPIMYQWAQKKGIDIVGTGDFTHPEWIVSLEQELEPLGNGLFELKKKYQKEIPLLKRKNVNTPRFMLSSEISCIYSKRDKVRRIHVCIYMPAIKDVKKFNAELSKIGNIHSDGRPILGLDAKELAKIAFDICPDALIIPAHAWTPWFSIFGSKSGFDSIEECFEEFAPHIPAIETGLSSDPVMNWRVSSLDSLSLVSNSDAHSPANLGREANVFDLDSKNISYNEINRILKKKDEKHFLHTIEFFPEEGKYHYDGHAVCKLSLKPEQTRKYKGICPKCGKSITVGVLSRVEDLADRHENQKPKNVVPYTSIVPLQQIIAESFAKLPGAKVVQNEYERLTSSIASEFEILLDMQMEELAKITTEEIVHGIGKVRSKKIYIEPGYDGVYGKVQVFSPKEKILPSQKGLFEAL